MIIAFVNNANVTEDKNHAIIYKLATDHIAEWSVLLLHKINT